MSKIIANEKHLRKWGNRVPSADNLWLNVRNCWKPPKCSPGTKSACPPVEDSKNALVGYDPQADNWRRKMNWSWSFIAATISQIRCCTNTRNNVFIYHCFSKMTNWGKVKLLSNWGIPFFGTYDPFKLEIRQEILGIVPLIYDKLK